MVLVGKGLTLSWPLTSLVWLNLWDLRMDRCVTTHGIDPAIPAPAGAPWSEYVRSQMNRSRSVSSSTEALDSDHARYITSRIAQHMRSLATSTRSLPTDSPVLTFSKYDMKGDKYLRVYLVIWTYQ